MSNLVKRKCNSEKNCTDCGNEIPLGTLYYGGSYKSLCISCGDIEKDITKEDVISSPNVKATNNSYVGKKCEFCSADSRGIMDSHYICPKPECADKALGIHNGAD